MVPWTPDPERHRPEGMDMAGRVAGVRPGLDPPEYSPAFQDAYHQLWYDASERASRYEKVLRNLIDWADDKRGDDLGAREWTEAREALDA